MGPRATTAARRWQPSSAVSLSYAKNSGKILAREGLLAIHGAWELLYSIIEETGINVRLQEVTTHLALSYFDDVLLMLKEKHLSDRLGLPKEDFLLAEDVAGDIPEEYQLLSRRCQGRNWMRFS